MGSTVHKKLIEALRFRTPEGENVVDILVRTIPMSKEAAYRRLRGEIQFTLAEASRLAERLGISIDLIAGIDKKDNYIFHIMQLFTDEPFEKYHDLQKTSLNVLRQMKKDPNTLLYFAGNILPPSFYLKYCSLSRYSFFKWIYQTSYSHGTTKYLADVVIPQKVLDIQRDLFSESTQVDTCFIIGDDLILSLVNDIKYFAAIDLVKPDEIAELKKEIYSLLDDMENATINGCFKSGKKATIYVSNACLDANYSYMTGADFQASVIYLFGINQLNCIDPTICAYQKQWIESLIAHSTLISGSGKLQGIGFFDRQKELLNTI